MLQYFNTLVEHHLIIETITEISLGVPTYLIYSSGPFPAIFRKSSDCEHGACKTGIIPQYA
jgi:hypothetical protein